MKYFNESTTTKFIKSLLDTSWVPTIEFWEPGEIVLESFIYISKDKIVKAVASGVPTGYLDTNFFSILEDFIPNKHYLDWTTTFRSKSDNYDIETHRALGNYLRFLKNYHRVDLFPFYNSYSGEYISDYRFGPNMINLTRQFNKDDSNIIFTIPIKFNQPYTIYLEATGDIYIAPTFYKDGFILDPNIILEPKIIKSNSVFNQPFVYEVKRDSITRSVEGVYAENLYLFIQVNNRPANKLLVIEGDFTGSQWINSGSVNSITKVRYGEGPKTEADADYFCKVLPDMFFQVGTVSNAFSSKLISYLLEHTITQADQIDDNITRVQNLIIDNGVVTGINANTITRTRYKKPISKSNFSPNERMFYYEELINNKVAPQVIAVNGWIDKDVEEMIMRGND